MGDQSVHAGRVEPAQANTGRLLRRKPRAAKTLTVIAPLAPDHDKPFHDAGRN
jgi:hypothetical protein